MPGVSVIVVVKNGERYLAQGLDSILAQTMAPAEIIVVIGESVDATAVIARSYGRALRIIMQADQGLANARNLGIEMASAELIAFLDHDDLWLPRKLAVQAETMSAQPTLQYTTTLMEFLLEEDGQAGSALAGQPAGVQDAGTPSGLMARKELFATLGSFNPAYQIGCDADWFVRARDHGIESAVIPEVLFYKRLHRSNLSRRGALNRKEMFQIARASLARQRQKEDDSHSAHH